MTEHNEKQYKYIDYLDEDAPITNQNWVCVSFLSPEGISNCTVRGIKIRGVYRTMEEANERAQEIQSMDPDFHVFVGEVGKWLAWDPDVNDENLVKDQFYYEKQLNDLMKGYKDERKKAKVAQEERKRDMLEHAAQQEVEHLSRDQKAKQRLGKKARKRRREKELENISTGTKLIDSSSKEKKNRKRRRGTRNDDNIIGDIKQIDKQIEEEKKEMLYEEKEIKQEEQSIISIEEQLAKIKSLYNTYNAQE